MFLAIGLGIGIGKIAQFENWYWNYYWKNHFQYYWYWSCYCINSFQHYWYWYWSQNFGIDHLWTFKKGEINALLNPPVKDNKSWGAVSREAVSRENVDSPLSSLESHFDNLGGAPKNLFMTLPPV